MNNDDTTHCSKCAATYRAQFMLNRCGDNTVSLPGSTIPGIAEKFYGSSHYEFTSCRNTHLLTFSGIYLWYICCYLDGRFSDLMEIDDLI